ncbi:MAG: putative NEK/NEK6 protein kinase [Streblomastix strix]|uniref:non-specific serine/threonine protein kinase n=1 Tax=Streblomastix strix TaxID=222440 RepID=A0A5J4WUE8_9EUKA|nr:MAG: putative NEK/NEK6 protein kinase [Streblomastix strix]
MTLSNIGYNDFKIKKKLGHGSQGRTYVVELLATQELLAMKKEEFLSDEDKARVQLEIDQMKRLESKFTVRLICSFQFDVDMCIVMELCQGGDLRKMITELQKLPEPERVMRVWAIVSQITRSLDHLHTNNVVHRDIKPENIFVNSDGSVRLGDFGLAKQLDEKDYATFAGTMVYMASEVWLTKKCDFLSDIFSCGIIAAELLTGKHPFFANNEHSIVERIKKGSYDQLPDFVPKDLKELVESMIDVDYSKRPTTKQIMNQSTINMYLRMQLEKEKDFEVAQKKSEVIQKKADEQALEIERLQNLLANTSHQHQQGQVQINPQISSGQGSMKSSLTKQNQIDYSTLSSSVLDIMKQDGALFTHSMSISRTTVLFDPVISSGIVRIEIINAYDMEGVGIADESVRFEKGENPHARGWEKIVYYRKMGDIGHNGGNWVVGNQPFIFAQQNVAMELNMDSNPRTLTFFVNDEEQPNYVTNIPQVVRFWACK